MFSCLTRCQAGSFMHVRDPLGSRQVRHDQSGVDSLDRIFTRRVNIGDDHMIRVRQSVSETLGKSTCATKQMRLEDDGYLAAVSYDPGLPESCFHLGRVVRVVINNASGAHLAAKFESATCT